MMTFKKYNDGYTLILYWKPFLKFFRKTIAFKVIPNLLEKQFGRSVEH